MKIAGIAQDFTPYARALSEASQNGRITLEGTIKGGHTSILGEDSFFTREKSAAFFLVLQF